MNTLLGTERAKRTRNMRETGSPNKPAELNTRTINIRVMRLESTFDVFHQAAELEKLWDVIDVECADLQNSNLIDTPAEFKELDPGIVQSPLEFVNKHNTFNRLNTRDENGRMFLKRLRALQDIDSKDPLVLDKSVDSDREFARKLVQEQTDVLKALKTFKSIHKATPSTSPVNQGGCGVHNQRLLIPQQVRASAASSDKKKPGLTPSRSSSIRESPEQSFDYRNLVRSQQPESSNKQASSVFIDFEGLRIKR